MTSHIRKFVKDNSGTTAVLFGLSLVPVGMAAGAGIEYAMLGNAEVRLQAALDSASLAASISYWKDKNKSAALSKAGNVFAAAIVKPERGAISFSDIDTTTGQVTLKGTVSVKTSVISLFLPSLKTIKIEKRADSIARIETGLDKNLEVALMLDVTTSMSQNSGTPNLTKLQAMKNAAKNLIDTVIQDDQSKKTSRVALAPFSSAINVGTYFRTINGSSPNRNWTSVVERSGAYGLTDDPPSTATFPSFRNARSTAKGTYGWYEQNRSSNVPATALVSPLSSNKSALKTAIDAYTANGTTAGQIGTAWTWYLLSDKWASVWTGASAPAANDSSTVKIAVLMSDFDYNVHYSTGNGDSNSQAAQLCANMKAAGITIYTIGFQVDANNASAQNLFTGCASSPDKAIPASTGSDLIAAYNTIASTVLAEISKSPVRLAR